MTRLSMLAVSALLFASASCNSGSLSIDTQPADQTVAVGQTAIFSVVASGTAPLTYQWQLNDAPIAGATQASTTTAAATLASNGSKYRVVVTDSTGSVTSNEAKLTVTGGSGPQTLTVHVTDKSGMPDAPFIAFQDGDGAWQSVTHVSSGDYSFTVSADRYGIAVADSIAAPNSPTGYLVQATVSEQPALNLPIGFAPPTFYKAEATVTHIPDGGSGSASLQNCGISDNTGHVDCPRVEAGLFDAIANAGDKTILKPDQQIFPTSNATTDLGLFDFATGLQKVTHMLTVHGLPPNQSFKGLGGFRQHFGTAGEDLPFYDVRTGIPSFTADANGDITFPILLLPYVMLASDSLEFFSIFTMMPMNGLDHRSNVSVQQYFNSPDDQTFTFPANFSATDASLATTTPYPRVQANWTPVSSLPVYGIQLLDGNHHAWNNFVTYAWIATQTPAHYVFPDLSAVTGWSSDFEFSSGSLQVLLSGYSFADLSTTISAVNQLSHFAPKVGDHLVIIDKGPTNLTVP